MIPNSSHRIVHKFILFLTLSVLSLQGVLAKPVTPKEAEQTAMDFFVRRKEYVLSRTSDANVPQLTLVYTGHRNQASATRSANDQTACYYIFNADNSAYVIVAGDDRACPILAYGDEGIFTPENIPANCAAWLKGYEKEMECLTDAEDNGQATPTGTIIYPTSPVAPLLNSMWGQNAPYNDLCPLDKSSGGIYHTLTGCVATAIAQIMYYHRWPEQPTGRVSYTDTAQGEERSMDFSTEAPFEWDKMLPDYADNATADQRNAVAQLMKCAGYGARMKYGAESSITYQRTGAEALYKYFGYDRNIHRYERSQTDEQEWINILIGELQAGRPVLYDGRNPSMGHSFVCDGYDGNEAFHFNWGWNGYGNGFYRLSALKPGTPQSFNYNDSYTFSQAIECHIQPSGKESVSQKNVLSLRQIYTVDENYVYRYEDTPLCIKRGQTANVGCRYLNNSHIDFTGQVCAAVCVNGQFTPVTRWVETVSTAGVSMSVSTTMPLTGTTSLPEGTYELTFWYRWSNDSKPIRLSAGNNGVDKFRMVLTTEELNLYPIHPTYHLALAEPLQTSPLYTNQTKPWTLTLYNDGEVRLEGYVGICLYKADEGINSGQMFKSLAYCEPGCTEQVTIQGDLTGIKRGSYLVQPFYCTQNSITATVTTDNIAALCDPIAVDITLKPMVTIQAQDGSYELDKHTGKVNIIVSQPSSLIPWTGRIYGKIFQIQEGENDREDTGVVLYSDILELTKPSITPCVLTGITDHLPTGTDYEITFYLEDGYEQPLHTQSLSITDCGTGINDLPSEQSVCISFKEADKRLHIVTRSALQRVTVCDMTGRLLADKPMEGIRETTCTLPGTTHSPLLVRIQTTDGVTVTKVMPSTR